MQQLTGLDNSFLLMEAGGQLGHVGSLALYDISGVGSRRFADAVRETIESRLHLLGPYRRRLVEVPLDLDRPYWIEDPNFDLDFHIRHIAVPPPGDEDQLSSLVSRIHSRALDRDKPLWEVYIIEGLENDRIALYSKIHHCTIDGVSGAQLAQVMMDRSAEGDLVKPPKKKWKPDAIPGTNEMLARGIWGAATQPGRAARTLYRTVRSMADDPNTRSAVAQSTGLNRVPVLGALLGGGDQVDADPIPQDPAPRTPWNRSITPHRRFAYFSHSLDTYKHIKNAFGTTLNDVVMAVTAGALRNYLEEMRELPGEPLKAMVPVSVRTEEEANTYSNRVTSILSELATNEADPVKRLMRIHDAMKSAKRIQQATPASMMQDLTELAMPALLAQAARISARTKVADRTNPPFNVIISNVPGPRESLYLGGAEMLTYYPVSAVAEGQGLNVTVTSYKDHLDWGLISCRELVPDVWALRDKFAEALEELEKAAGRVAR